MPDTTEAAPADLEARLAQYRPQIQRHILAMVRDTEDAEELTQETYARALARIDGLREPQAALAWLYRIATNVSLDRLRREATVPVNTAVSAEQADEAAKRERPESLIEAGLERSEMSECVQDYLVRLPDDYRVAIFLHDVYGLSNPEIARLLGCSLATAKIRVHRARRRLRETLASACAFELDERGVLVCEPRSETPSPTR
jgi:RNA polymerase sigma-70 factor (ECF subfamily)